MTSFLVDEFDQARNGELWVQWLLVDDWLPSISPVWRDRFFDLKDRFKRQMPDDQSGRATLCAMDEVLTERTIAREAGETLD